LLTACEKTLEPSWNDPEAVSVSDEKSFKVWS